MSTSGKLLSVLLCAVALLAAFSTPVLAAERAPSVLFLSVESRLDRTYGEKLSEAGIQFTRASLYDPIDLAFMRRFDVIVVDKFGFAGDEFNTFGQRMLHVWDNLGAAWQALEDGAGVLVYTNLADCGGGRALGWNEAMARFGIQLRQACVLDTERAIHEWRAYSKSWYVWTENLPKHPVTEGLRRIYFASANLRWDDCYTTTPLVCDKTWTPILRAMPTARIAYDVQCNWVDASEQIPEPVLGAVRTVGKGRLGVLAIDPAYVHSLGYVKRKTDWYGEMCYGPLDGVVLEKGDGEVPSDLGKLVMRLYGWLGEGAPAAGLGGYVTGEPVPKRETVVTREGEGFEPVLDFDDLKMPPPWRHRPAYVKVGKTGYFPEVLDAITPGEVQFRKALVGAHTSLSDGKGTVAQYAKAAAAAGYALVCFTEAFEHLTPKEWDVLVADCRKASTGTLVCLPGIDILDADGSRFLIVAPPYYPRPSWLSEDGKRLVHTQMINLLYGNHYVVAHRPETSSMPQERFKHFHGLSVATYRGGKLVDDGMEAYAWQAMNASNPHPTIVHEVYAPGEVARAARTGYQQIIPGDTLDHAVGYFRNGIVHYFEAPSRHMVSEGPIVTNFVCRPKDFGPAAENRMQFRVDVGARSDVPLAVVELHDGPRVVRRWLPKGKEFEASAHFRHRRQYALFVTARDTKGRRVLTASVRTVPPRFIFRCADRQNWLGHTGAHYTGTRLPSLLRLKMPIKGTEEGNGIFSAPGSSMAGKLSFPLASPDVVLTECILDEKYVSAVSKDAGADAMPSRASEPSTVYEGRVRHWAFTPREGSSAPALIEYEVKLKRDVEPRGPAGLFPEFYGLAGAKAALIGADGNVVVRDVTRADSLDVPAGSLACGFVALCDGLRVRNGHFGLALPPDSPAVIPAGTVIKARFLIYTVATKSGSPIKAFDKDPAGMLKAFGLTEHTPYAVSFARGQRAPGTFPWHVAAADHGTAGSVEKTAETQFDVVLEVEGANPNWTAGVWREDGTVAYGDVFEGSAMLRLDVSRAGNFYAGNLLVADNSGLVLEVITWTPERVKIEVHNPTDATVQAVVSTPAAVKGLKALRKTVEVPAGTTLLVDE